ncbi:uncharacterized protein V2V93DRAFT_370026 [Kockiozyma suomiensis]|uniref:uncharacterized protein n=1 Tax=Kockiozyma suomiensis TaxID=1337062 RepID=UPI003343B78D
MSFSKSLRDALSRNIVEPARKSHSRSRSRSRSHPRQASHAQSRSVNEQSAPQLHPQSSAGPPSMQSLPSSPNFIHASSGYNLDTLSIDDSDSSSLSELSDGGIVGMEELEAESIIGGSSVHNSASKTFRQTQDDHEKEEAAESHSPHAHASHAKLKENLSSSGSSSQTDASNNGNQGRRIFPFSLPFAASYHPPLLPSLKDMIPSLGTASDSNASHQGMLSRSSISLKKRARALSIFKDKEGSPASSPPLHHQHEFPRTELVRSSTEESIADSILEDEKKFANIHQMDNSRLRAVKETLRTSMSMDQLFSTPKDGFPEDLTGDVVILGGYRGSILRDAKTRRRVWIPIKVGLNIRKINLELGLSDYDEKHADRDIIADGMLTHIGPVDISRRLVRRMQSSSGCTVHDFGYDWRLSNDLLAEELVDYLIALKHRRGPHWNGAIVIAHSMGGIIAHAAMQHDPSLFRGVLYVGSPSSCVNILGPIRHGDSVMLSTKVLAAQVNFAMRSSFVFLPLDGRCFVDKNTGREIRLDFFDVKTWIKYGLSPCIRDAASPTPRSTSVSNFRRSSSSEKEIENSHHQQYLQQQQHQQNQQLSSRAEHVLEPTSMGTSSNRRSLQNEENDISYSDAKTYLEQILPRTKKFKESLLVNDPSVNYPPLAIVYGPTVPTVRGARVNGERGIIDGDFSDYIFTPGDGVVPARHLMPPRGFNVVAKVSSDRGHVGLLSDLPAIGKALRAILDEEKRRRIEGPPTVEQRIKARTNAEEQADAEDKEEDEEMRVTDMNMKSTIEEAGAGIAGLTIH